MFQAINQYIQACTSLTVDELQYFNHSFIAKAVPAKTLLLKAGDICDTEAFIVKGCIKTYFLDSNGHEVILTFATENWWVSDIISFHEKKPSKMYIETIEATELLILTPSIKEKVLQKIPALERLFRLMVQRHLASYQERIFDNIALSAEERYEKFLQKYPLLPQRIPQHLIASYLGMSAEFLSKIRKRRIEKR
jgi:CRP/FNR family transcriptional regulator, cyclic AMP receptor protein